MMMKRSLLMILVLLGLAVPAAADDFIYHGSFLWNDIRSVVHRDSLMFCAFHDGIGVINLNRDFIKKKLYAAMEVPGNPERLHMYGNLLVVEGGDTRVTLVDITDPVNMQILGSFDPEPEVYDIAVLEGFLYAAIEYDGIVRYDISDPGNIFLVDSSMAGIRVIRLEVYEARLYALDTYNGVLVYEPDADGFGAPVSRLYLPEQAVSLAVIDDTVYTGLNPNGYLVGSVADVYNPVYVGKRSSLIRGDIIAAASKGIVLANGINGFELIYSRDSLLDQVFPVLNIRGYPTVFSYNGRTVIVYPNRLLGFTAYDIEDPIYVDTDFPDYVYAYPGPITQVTFINSRLHVIGTNNWYEMYDLSDPAHPARTGKMINPPWKPAGVCAKGDTLFVADKDTDTFFPALDDGTGDPEWMLPYFGVVDSIARPHLIPEYFVDMDLLYFYNDRQINGTARNDSTVIPSKYRWTFPAGVSAAVFDGPRLYRVNHKGVLFIYNIDRLGQLEQIVQYYLPSQPRYMIKIDSLLYMLGSGLRLYNISDPASPQWIHTELSVGNGWEMMTDDSWLICASDPAIWIYDISAGIPQPLFSGGSGAVTVAYEDHVLASSDGYSVKVYTLPVVSADDDLPHAFDLDGPRLDGYPNPFNPQITLRLANFGTGREPVIVDVLDILGRRLRRLTVQPDNAGGGRVVWDGRDDDNMPAPSGIYLFRAYRGSDRAVFKGVLLK